MYNPYNWEIVKENKEVKMNLPVFPKAMNKCCILDELTKKSSERDIVNLEVTEIINDLKSLRKTIEVKENRLKIKLEELYKLDEDIRKICQSLPAFDK